jgi:Carbohydrate family 9 binding domain-like
LRYSRPVRSTKLAVLLLLATQAACRRGGGIAGDATITGTPARVPHFAARPTIDGKLDEAVWQTATVLGPFVDTGDGHGVSSNHPVAATARIGWDADRLYLGFVVADRQPVSPFGRDDPDPHLWGSASAVEIMLQPGDPGDNRDYYEIQVDTAGAIFDTHWDDYMTPLRGGATDRVFGHQEWSSAIERAATVEPGRSYAIEMALPWSSLSTGRTPIPPHAGDVWRLNLYSFRDGQRLALGWSSIRGEGNFHRSSRFGRVRFE